MWKRAIVLSSLPAIVALMTTGCGEALESRTAGRTAEAGESTAVIGRDPAPAVKPTGDEGFRHNWLLPPVFGVEWERNDLDIYPSLRSGKAPPYPFGMKTVGGYATVQFKVDEEGNTTDIEVLDMSHPYFGGNAAYVIKYWHFNPAELSGESVPVHGVIRWNFVPISRWVKTSVQEELKEANENG